MRKSGRKLASVITVAAMALSLTACSNHQGETAAAEAATEAVTETAAEKETTEEESSGEETTEAQEETETGEHQQADIVVIGAGGAALEKGWRVGEKGYRKNCLILR